MHRSLSFLTLIGVGALFALSAWLGMALTAGFGRIALIWFANGFVVGAMLLCQRNPLLWFGLPAVAYLVNVSLNIGYLHDSPAFALTIAGANTLEIFVAAYGLRSVRSVSSELLQLRFLIRFFLVAIVA